MWVRLRLGGSAAASQTARQPSVQCRTFTAMAAPSNGARAIVSASSGRPGSATTKRAATARFGSGSNNTASTGCVVSIVVTSRPAASRAFHSSVGAAAGKQFRGSLSRGADELDEEDDSAIIAARQKLAAEAAASALSPAEAARGVGEAGVDTSELDDSVAPPSDTDDHHHAPAAAAGAETGSDPVQRLEQTMAQRIAEVNMKYDTSQTYSRGTVYTINKGFAIVDGLPTANLGALVNVITHDGRKLFGYVTSMDHHRCSVALLHNDAGGDIRPGDTVTHHNDQVPTFPSGMGVVGRVLNALGEPLDGLGPVINCKNEPSVDRPVPGITARAPVQSMIESGIKHFDIFHPLAKGLRMGLFGPRKSGKSSISAKIICNQAASNKPLPLEKKLYCIYVLVGQSKAHNEKVIRSLRQSGAMDYTTVVVAENSAPVAMQYLAPYAGCTAAEYFRDNGMHSFIVYDDMSAHGAAYNLMARSSGARLLATTFVQAKILERASYMSQARGGGSMTALCLFERHTETPDALSNMEGFVDQIVYTDAQLTVAGFWPPMNCAHLIGRPPTRYQPEFTRPVTRLMTELICHSLESAKAYEWAQKFRLPIEDDEIEVLEFKDKLQVLLSQERAMPLPLQFISLYAAGKQLLGDIEIELVPEWEKQLHLFMYHHNRTLLHSFEVLTYSSRIPAELLSNLDDALQRFSTHFAKLVADHQQRNKLAAVAAPKLAATTAAKK